MPDITHAREIEAGADRGQGKDRGAAWRAASAGCLCDNLQRSPAAFAVAHVRDVAVGGECGSRTGDDQRYDYGLRIDPGHRALDVVDELGAGHPVAAPSRSKTSMAMPFAAHRSASHQKYLHLKEQYD